MVCLYLWKIPTYIDCIVLRSFESKTAFHHLNISDLFVIGLEYDKNI